MRFRLVAVSLAAEIAFTTFAPTFAAAETGSEPQTELVSAGDASIVDFEPTTAISADGRFVIFAAGVQGDDSNTAKLYVRDRKLKTTQRIRVSASEGIQLVGSTMSADGRWLGVSGWDPVQQRGFLFLYDRTTRKARRVASAFRGALSADGRWMLFSTNESLVPGDVEGTTDFYLYDQSTSGYTRVPVFATGAPDYGWAAERGISADGRFILFDSCAPSIVKDDTNEACDVFQHDRRRRVTHRVSVDSAGAQANEGSWQSTMSDDGRYVAFTSVATNLVAGDTNGQADVFVRDMATGLTTRVSVGGLGAEGSGWSEFPVLSGNGKVVAFRSSKSLVPNVPLASVFVHDLAIGSTRQADVSSKGRRTDGGGGWNISISHDGRFVAFTTGAQLVPQDAVGYDVYLRDLGTRGPSDRLTGLIDDVTTLGAPIETRAGLTRLAQRAADAVERRDRPDACRAVVAFIYDVQAHWNRDLLAADAAHLFAGASQTQRDLGCPAHANRAFEFHRSRFRLPEPSSFGLSTGDFDGDGHIDAAIAHAESISVFAGDGHASFGKLIRIPGLRNPIGLTSADLNRDGVSDLVATNADAASASVFLATRGRLEFTRADLPTGQYPSSVAAGDFTGDGVIDLAVANANDFYLSLYRGTGRGRFSRMEDLYIGYAASNVAIADVDGDRCADILMSGRAAVSLALGSKGGQPTFWNHLAYGPLRELAVADFNLDSRPDVAFVSGDYTPEVQLLMNTGGGVFDAGGVVDVPFPSFLAAGDLNGDGRPDLMTNNRSYGQPMWVVQGNGDGTFGILERFDGDIDASSINVADLNHDGALDVLVLASTARSLFGKGVPSLNVLVNRPRVSVTTANDPADWAIGSDQVIAWRHALPRATTFRVELSRDNGVTWKRLATSVRATGSSARFTWRVTGPATAQARVRVTAEGDATAVDLNDTPMRLSDAFVRLAGLNDTQWAIGSTQTIRYTHNLGSRVALAVELSRDGGRTWSVLAEDARTNGSQSGTWNWTVTGPMTGNALITVRAANGLAAGTFSGITIAAPFIRLLPIRPATPWNACESREVRWMSNLGPNELVDFEVSSNEGATWSTAAQSKRGKASYAPPEHVLGVTLRARWAKHGVVAPAAGPFAVLTTPAPNWCDDGQ
jgi:Tol biopolymer transport system component